MSHVQNQQATHGIMLALAPSLRDKFDFSDDSQFAKWADLSYKAAEAFGAKMKPLVDAAAEKDRKEFAERQAKSVAEAAKPAPLTEVTPASSEPKAKEEFVE